MGVRGRVLAGEGHAGEGQRQAPREAAGSSRSEPRDDQSGAGCRRSPRSSTARPGRIALRWRATTCDRTHRGAPVDDQPVGAVAQHPQQVSAEGRPERRGHRHEEDTAADEEEHHERGQEPTGRRAGRRTADRDGPRPRVLLAEQRRDQKAAGREEHVDAEEAARDPARVIGEDGEHGDSAETIESRPIAEIEGFGGPRHAGE